MSKKNIIYNQEQLDLLISNLKSELFEKEQNRKDYNILENNYNKLKEEILYISNEKQKIKNKYSKSINEDNNIINKYQTENENINEELNKKNLLNKKLYEENNEMYQILESKAFEKKKYIDKIKEQKIKIKKLKAEKNNFENLICELNIIQKKQEKDIDNLKEGINLLNKNINNYNSNFTLKNEKNEKIISTLSEEKNLKKILKSRLKKKDFELNKLSREFSEIKITLNELEENLNNKKNEYNIIKEEIDKLNNDYAKESTKKIQLINENKNINEIIKTKEKNIKKLNEENNQLKKSNTDLIYFCTNLQNKDNIYKNHILTMTEQNGKLSNELENIINDDENIIYKLTRVDYLKNIKEENKEIISSSLTELKNHFIKYGNMGANSDCSIDNTNNNKIYLNTYNTINIDNNELNKNDSLENSLEKNPKLINTLFQNEKKENKQYSEDEEQVNIEKINNE